MTVRNPLLLSSLRLHLASSVTRQRKTDSGRISLGLAGLDESLGGGLERGALHEVYAPATSDLPSAIGFAAGIALLAAHKRPIVWVRQEFLDVEAGSLYAPGLAEFGLDPAGIVLVRARDKSAVLKAGREATLCGSLGAVLIQPWADAPDLTASRRLSLAAEASGGTALMVIAGSPVPSAAQTRWEVRPFKSRSLPASAPGSPAFLATLLRHRGGAPAREWRLEWNRDCKCFHDRSVRHQTPLSRPLVSVPSSRSRTTGIVGLRKTG